MPSSPSSPLSPQPPSTAAPPSTLTPPHPSHHRQHLVTPTSDPSGCVGFSDPKRVRGFDGSNHRVRLELATLLWRFTDHNHERVPQIKVKKKARTSEAHSRIVGTNPNTRMELGQHHYGLFTKLPKDIQGYDTLVGEAQITRSRTIQRPLRKSSPDQAKIQAARDRQKKKSVSRQPLPFPVGWTFVFDDKLHFVEEPLEIVGHEVKRLKRSRIPLVKVRWNSKRGPEFTWEREDQFKKKYPHLFTKTTSSSSAASRSVSTRCQEYIGDFVLGSHAKDMLSCLLKEQLLEPALNLTVHCCGLEFRVQNGYDQKSFDKERGLNCVVQTSLP
ncbi:hypothetical protein Tco_0250241 [Tanacetum coccineum]